MAALSIHKVIGALPATLLPDALYFVRVGQGFDIYVTDVTGSIAHKANDLNTGTAESGMPDGTTSLFWLSGLLQQITFPDSSNLVLTWSGDVLVGAALIGDTTRSATFNWSNGVLTSITTSTA